MRPSAARKVRAPAVKHTNVHTAVKRSESPSGYAFLPCCPCRALLSERACTPSWCFTYRYLDWLLTICVVIVAVWGVLLTVLGADTVGPGSPLFALAVVVLVAYAVGWGAYYHLSLPPTVGMLTVGVVYRNVPLCWDATGHLEPTVISSFKSLLFTVSAVKAGLYFDGAVFPNYGLTIVLLGFIPCILEGMAITLAAHFLFPIPLMWAFTLGVIWGGVSPILLSFCLVSLASNGYGTKTGIVSILIAAGTVDNTVTIILFEILSETIKETSGEFAYLRIVMKLVLSVTAGCLLGCLLACVPNRYSRHALLARASLLILSLFVLHRTLRLHGLDTAAFIGSVTTASSLVYCWRFLGWHEDASPLREVYEMLWHSCQPIAMVLVGMSANLAAMNTNTVWKVIILHVVSLVARAPITYMCTTFSQKPPKQRLFIAFAYWSKGILQTTLGALALDTVRDDPELSEKMSTSISMAVMIGTYMVALIARFLGPLLLPKAEE